MDQREGRALRSTGPDRRRSRGLTPIAERRLVIEAQEGRMAQRERLVEVFRPSIAAIARHYRSAPSISRDELMQEGVVGLLRALERYDPTMEVPFWAYASWWVRQAMQHVVAELSRPVVLSDRAIRQLACIKQAERDCGQRSGRGPSTSTLACVTGVSCSQIDRLRAAERAAAGLDEPVGRDGGETFAELLSDAEADDPLDVAVFRIAADELPDALQTLTERERTVVRGRFGFDGRDFTLAELGEQLGVSAERVRQVERAALDKLRDRSENLRQGAL
jgi:RNA polymerase sigma factor (sigma-70 family)